MKPTLASAYTGRMPFPLMASPKLDGIRAIVRGGVVLSRTGKPIPSADVQSAFAHLEGFDGELIAGGPFAPDVFKRSTSGAMARDGTGCAFYAFDHQSGGDFAARYARLQASDRVHVVNQVLIRSVEELAAREAQCVAQGYEGIMIRDPAAPYIEGRTTALQKLKRFEDSEAECVGMIGQLSGVPMVGALICRTASGDEVRVSSGITEPDRLRWYQAPPIGALVRYRHARGDPLRFPSFAGLRDRSDI